MSSANDYMLHNSDIAYVTHAYKAGSLFVGFLFVVSKNCASDKISVFCIGSFLKNGSVLLTNSPALTVTNRISTYNYSAQTSSGWMSCWALCYFDSCSIFLSTCKNNNNKDNFEKFLMYI